MHSEVVQKGTDFCDSGNVTGNPEIAPKSGFVRIANDAVGIDLAEPSIAWLRRDTAFRVSNSFTNQPERQSENKPS